MKKIIALIEDMTQISDTLEWALKNQAVESKIVLGYVYPPRLKLAKGFSGLTMTDLQRRQIIEREYTLLLYWKQYLKNKGYQVEIVEIDGTRIKHLLELLNDEKFDLLVMQTDTRSWLEDKIYGTPWSQLINNTNTPIFFIPCNAKQIA